MKKSVVLGVLVILLGLSLAGVANAQQDQVCFYEHINYQGRYVCWGPGMQHGDLTQLNWSGMNWNDKISSVKFFGNARCTIFQHINYQGNSLNMVHSTPDLRYVQLSDGRTYNWNDTVSALRVYY